MQRRDSSESRSREWIDNEMVRCESDDVRHRKRLRRLLEHFSDRVGSTTPWASQDWANTKAAYRFFSNQRISDRLAGDGRTTISAEMKRSEIRGLHPIGVRDHRGEATTAVLELRFRRIRVRPPKGKEKHYPQLVLTAIHAKERDKPKGREKINWKLLTDLPVRSCLDAIEKLEWYAQRWKIETFHKILKSGCKAEEAKLRTAERLVNLLAILCILSWRIFWITMLNRTSPNALPDEAFTELDQTRPVPTR